MKSLKHLILNAKCITLLGVIFTALLAVSCEEDDVCVGEGTPYLTVVFRNIQNQENLSDTIFVERLDPGQELIDTLYAWVVTDSIKLPLGGVEESVSHFKIRKRTTGSADILTVNYESQTTYVSKACGFRLTYGNLNYDATSNEIENIQTGESNTLENESATNLYIYYNSF